MSTQAYINFFVSKVLEKFNRSKCLSLKKKYESLPNKLLPFKYDSFYN